MSPSALEWTLAAGLVAGGLVIGLLTGEPGWSLFGASLVWSALQLRERRALERWSRAPLRLPRQHLDTWDALADRLYRLNRRSRRRSRRMIEMFGNLRTMTDALPDAAVVIDSSGAIESFNGAAEELLHLERTDRGGNLPALLRQPDFVALARGRQQNGIVEFASPYDDDRRLEARRIPISGGHALLLVRDVTQLNRLLTMRQDFVANVSHELRTPLTVIMGYLETMTGEELDAATLRELAGKLEPPAHRMRALVDDLLLLSRLESDRPPGSQDLVPLEMSGIVRTCISEARDLSDGRHKFEVEVDKSTRLLGIEREIHSAIMNMLTNAVRYSPDGGRIVISWEPIEDGGARLAVEDEGIGIAPEHLERIMERFFRVDLAKSRVRGGTGLGLAIVKHVLKRHRSQLMVESAPGRGSRFYCDFPEALVQSAPAANGKR
jgi:two-component system phosphate regulon sensor histidine kinase PhoR